MTKLAVVGAGLAGLAAARRLEQLDPGADVWVYEAQGRVGGVVRSEPPHGGAAGMEAGPDSLLVRKPSALALIKAVALDREVVPSHPGAKGALLYLDGRLVPIPAGVVAGVPLLPERLADAAVLSPEGRAAVLADLSASPETLVGDVSLGGFLERRLGREWLDHVASPLLSGIYAGHVRDLSLLATYPELADAARQGSLIRGLAAQRAAHPPAPGPMFVTLASGLEALPREVARQLRRPVRLAAPVASVVRAGRRYRLRGRGGLDEVVDGVVLATPAWVAARQLAALAPAAVPLLEGVPYANLAVVVARFPVGVSVPPGMTGILAPAGSGVALTAVTFVGQKWAHRAPLPDVPVRIFYGRAAAESGEPSPDDDVLAWSDGRFRQQVADDLRQVLGWGADPLALAVHRHPATMPQYRVGHRERVERLEALVRGMPGLALAGAAYHGVGIPDVIADGERAAAQVVQSLSTSGRAP